MRDVPKFYAYTIWDGNWTKVEYGFCTLPRKRSHLCCVCVWNSSWYIFTTYRSRRWDLVGFDRYLLRCSRCLLKNIIGSIMLLDLGRVRGLKCSSFSSCGSLWTWEVGHRWWLLTPCGEDCRCDCGRVLRGLGRSSFLHWLSFTWGLRRCSICLAEGLRRISRWSWIIPKVSRCRNIFWGSLRRW